MTLSAGVPSQVLAEMNVIVVSEVTSKPPVVACSMYAGCEADKSFIADSQ